MLWIQEPRDYAGSVTGTILMRADEPSALANPSQTLKTSKEGIVLVPQPQASPNDPLNWPTWKRDLVLVVIGMQSFIVGGQSPLLAAGLTTIGTEFKASPSKVSYLVGGFMLSLGFGSVLASPTAVLYGKRIVYLGGIIVFMAGSIWAACAQSFGSLMGARVITGLGASPCESLPSATISEIYYAHERAYRLGIYTMLLLGGKNLVPMLAGFVFQSLNRHWLYWILTIILGINLVLTFLFAPETIWNRHPVSVSSKGQLPLPPLGANGEVKDVDDVGSTILTAVNEEVPVQPVPPTATTMVKRLYLLTLHVSSGRHTPDHWWMVALRPFVLLLYPSVLFGAFLYAFAVVWLILISETVSHLFTNPPYNYSVIVVGLFYVSPFVGGTLGSVVAGKASDLLVHWLVVRNKGVYEPEFRLFMVVPVFITVCMGLIGFGWATEVHDQWIIPVVFFGILGFGCSLASTAAITYTVDSYRLFAAEALVTLNLTKNVLGFIFSLFTTSFVDRRGCREAFAVFGAIQVVVCLAAVPLFFYGKRCRHWTDRRRFMNRLYAKDELATM